MPEKSTVFIIEDDDAVNQALVCLFQSVALKTESFSEADTFVKRFNAQCRGCIVADIRMPKMSGLDLQAILNEYNNHLPIIFITGHGDVAMAVRAMKAGAFDFIMKPFNNQTLLEQVQRALTLVPSIEQKKIITEKLKSLTAREREIFMLIIDGSLNKEIAHKLNISLSTVEMHRSHIMEKMHAKNIAELIKSYYLAQ